MKKFLKHFAVWTLIFLVVDFVIVFVFSSLQKSNIISEKTADITVEALGIISFFFYAFTIGSSAKKRGLLTGLLLCGIYLIAAFITLGLTDKLTTFKIVMIIIKGLSLITGAIMGVNHGAKSIAKK